MFLEGIEKAGSNADSKLDVDGNVPTLCISSHNIMKKSFEASCSTAVEIDTLFDIDMSKYKLCDFCYFNPPTNKNKMCMLAF